jgi:hypothetical protein
VHRLLFWLDIDLEQFGIAKYLQEKYKGEYYAIIDINDKAKRFFQQQTFVNFTKIWYYRDHITNSGKNPDMEYLKHFEQKYGINIWKIAYAERYFFLYNPYHKFTDVEILSLLEQECKLFEKILDDIQPDILVIKPTDYHQNYLLHQICKARGIRILTYGGTRFECRAMISEDLDIMDNLEITKSKGEKTTLEELQQALKKYYHRHSENHDSLFQRIRCGLEFLIFVCNNNYRRFYANRGRTRIKVLYNELLFLLKRYVRECYVNKYSIKSLEKNQLFIYFPLHLEPERELLIAAPFYTNQLEVIVSIAKSLPVEYKLYVKDHPKMREFGWRETSYYKKIINLPNVKLVHHSVSNYELLKNCSMVITIGGTAGLEAAFYGKPTIVFRDTIYSKSIPSVHRLNSIEMLPITIRSLLHKKINSDNLSKFIQLIEENTFKFDIFSLKLNIDNLFFHGGLLKDVEIPIETMEQFLIQNRDLFSKLADEHMKKIAL